MNAFSVVRSILAVCVFLFGSPVANADCVISGVRPTVPLPTMELGQEFSFIASADCETLRFRVQGTTFTKMPKAGTGTGPRDRTYKVRVTESEWDSVVDESDTTFRWSIIGTTSAGVTTQVTTTNQLDFDRDGWTRREGDAGECDYASARNPGVVEICDDINQDCDGLTDEDAGPWFQDADGDGYGDDADRRCDWAEGYVDVGGDCDDSDSDAWCPTLDLTLADAKLVGEEGGDCAGVSVSGAGDVDGDGHEDVLVGAYLNDEGGTYAGAAYLVLGPVTGTLDLSLADAKLVGEGPDDAAGYSVSGAGDVDGDGHDDVLVVALSNAEGGAAAGAAYLVLGPVTGTLDLSLADAKIVGEEIADYAGSVSDAGDVNGDSHDDVLVGASGNDEGGTDAGAAYLVLGPVTGTLDLSLADAKLVGEEIGDHAASVSGAGDVDGDGNYDVLVGASGNDEGGSSAGAAYLVLGPVTGTLDLSLADAKLVGEGSDDGAGGSVSGAGDVDGDGHVDLLVGAYGYDEYVGAAYLVRGPVSGTFDLSLADAKLVGERAYDLVGNLVSDAGDVDADGHDDLLVGALGLSYLVLGPVTGTLDLARSGLMFVGEDTAGTVSGAGDVDGDGHDDVLVGALYDSGGAGAAYLIYGGGLY